MTIEDGLEAIRVIIDALQVFVSIEVGPAPSGPDPKPSADPACWIRPSRWGPGEPLADEIWDGGSSDGDFNARTVHFEVEIFTDRPSPAPSDLADAVQSAVHGRILADSFPAVCREGTYTRFGTSGKTPTHRLTVIGRFSYLV